MGDKRKIFGQRQVKEPRKPGEPRPVYPLMPTPVSRDDESERPERRVTGS